jgi:hypothetical protein
LVLDRHKNYQSVVFQDYCKANNIIILCLFSHLFYLIQPLDVRCFSILKRIYGYQIETFIKTYINYIIKVEFFLAFHVVYNQLVIPENAITGFHGTSLVPFNPQTVISKLDIKLRTPIPIRPLSADTDPWVSQIPHNPINVFSQIILVKNNIACY